MEEEKVIVQQDVVVPKSETKVSFGQLNAPTPMWAKIAFRITIIITSAATFIIASDPAISDDIKIRLGVYLKGFDLLILGLSNLFGIIPSESIKD